MSVSMDRMIVMVPVAAKRGSRDLVALFVLVLAAMWVLFWLLGDTNDNLALAAHTEV